MEKLITATPEGRDRKQKELDRRERELDERIQQEDARVGDSQRAEQDASADAAQEPERPRSRATSEQAFDGPVHASETRHAEETRSKGTRRTAGDAQDGRAPKAARGTPQDAEEDEPSSKRF